MSPYHTEQDRADRAEREVDRLEDELDRLEREVDRLECELAKRDAENKRLTDAIDDAPHWVGCGSVIFKEDRAVCSCWKSKALNQESRSE